MFGDANDRQTVREFDDYRNSGGTMGYDSWRQTTGLVTRSFTNDLGIRGNIIGTRPNDDGSLSIFTQNSPVAEAIVDGSGVLRGVRTRRINPIVRRTTARLVADRCRTL